MSNRELEGTYNKSWALIVGINEYSDFNIPNLKNAENDALAVSKELIKRFDFQEENVILLLGENATRIAIQENYERLSEEDVQVNDRLFLYFSGHGTKATSRWGEERGYFLAFDSVKGKRSSYLPWKEMVEEAYQIPAKHIFFVCDACYSGTFTRGILDGQKHFVEDLLKRRSIQVLTSGKGDQLVQDGNGVFHGHSIFASRFLEALKGGAQNESSKIITASNVINYVYHWVGAANESLQIPQHGQFILQNDGDFIFNPWDTEPQEWYRSPKLFPSSPSKLPKAQDQISLVKEFLFDPTKQIELHTLIKENIKRFLVDIEEIRSKDSLGSHNRDAIPNRIKEYEAATKALIEISMIIGYHGNSDHSKLLRSIINSFKEEPFRSSPDDQVCYKLGSYPLFLIFYSVGLSAFQNQNFGILKPFFEVTTQLPFIDHPKGKQQLVNLVKLIREKIGTGADDCHSRIQEYSRNAYPICLSLSNYFEPVMKSLDLLEGDLAPIFDRFEILTGLAHCYQQSNSGRNVGVHSTYLGRYIWNVTHPMSRNQPFKEFGKEILEGMHDEIVEAGLFGGTRDNLYSTFVAYRRALKR